MTHQIPEPVADDRARVIALTEDERTAIWRTLHEGEHGISESAVFAVVERILAQRAAPDPRIEKVRAVLVEIEAERPAIDLETHPPGDESLIPAMIRRGAMNEVVAKVRAVLDGDPTAPAPLDLDSPALRADLEHTLTGTGTDPAYMTTAVLRTLHEHTQRTRS